MRGLALRFVVIGACAVLVACAARPTHDRVAVDGFAAAERAFAAAAERDGVQAAFLGALASDSTLFRPGPVDGRTYTSMRPDPAIRLEWHPQRVAVASSGDLGFSTGPYRLAPTATPDRIDHGQFFSIWRRDAGGRWQVLFDQGIGHGRPATRDVPLERLVAEPGQPPTGDVARAEAGFTRVSQSGGQGEAYRLNASTSVRLLREGLEPLDGLASIERLPQATAMRRWIVDRSGLAAAGDFAWVTGRYRDEGSVRNGYFVRVWRVEGGRWVILADVLAPIDGPAR